MPYEMVDYIQTQTDLKVFERVGGDLDLLKRFLAAGYPVLVEKGTYLRDLTGVVSWMGHYQVITGYDEASRQFIAQDSFIKPDHPVSYEEMIDGWRAFNYTYLIIFPPEKEAEVQALLGSDADETTNYQNAALKASNEIYGLAGIDQYFAWFNRGTNLVNLQDYAGASAAYDEAFKVYPTIPENERPWRMLWYQTGPYFAYYYAQRYYDLLYLSDGTLSAMQGDKNLEESYYWRGMARAASGRNRGCSRRFPAQLEISPGASGLPCSSSRCWAPSRNLKFVLPLVLIGDTHATNDPIPGSCSLCDGADCRGAAPVHLGRGGLATGSAACAGQVRFQPAGTGCLRTRPGHDFALDHTRFYTHAHAHHRPDAACANQYTCRAYGDAQPNHSTDALATIRHVDRHPAPIPDVEQLRPGEPGHGAVLLGLERRSAQSGCSSQAQPARQECHAV